MAQKARPAEDLANDGWSPTPLYDQLAHGLDVTALVPPDRTFVVRLGPLAAPIVGPPREGTAVPPHRLTVDLRGTCGAVAVVYLLAVARGADRLLGRWQFRLTEAVVRYELPLERPAAALIEDYAAVKVMVTAFHDPAIDCRSSSSHSSSSRSLSSYASTSSSYSSSRSRSAGSDSSSSSSSSPIVGGCCPGTPTSLLASVSIAGAFLASISITRDGAKYWQGGPPALCPVYVRFWCDEAGPGCDNYHCQVSCDLKVSWIDLVLSANHPCTCSPPMWEFTGSFPESGCISDCFQQDVLVVITE